MTYRHLAQQTAESTLRVKAMRPSAGDSMVEHQLHGNRVPNEREKRVIELVAQGLKNREIAQALGTTEFVVKNYLKVIYDKLGLWNRVELALWYESRKHQSQTMS